MSGDNFPPFGSVPTRPRCASCRRVIVVDMHVPDELWAAVMRSPDAGYACVDCFASRADEKMINWAPHITLTPMSLVMQFEVQRRAADERREQDAS